MDTKNKLSIDNITETLTKYWKLFNKFRFVIFLIFIGLSYVYLYLQVNTAINQSPLSTTSPPSPSTNLVRINPQVVNQLESLKDNSVNVQVLFEQARNNPFQ